MANPNWKKGTSGNPAGRPPKERALTDTLERAGRSAITDIDGKRRAGNRVVARVMWELATYGRATLPPKEEGGESVNLEIGAKGWFEVVKWLHAQIDGPPKTTALVENTGKMEIILKWPEAREGADD